MLSDDLKLRCFSCLAYQTVELAARSKELRAATSKREQLEGLLEKAEGSQVMSTDLKKQVRSFLTRTRGKDSGQSLYVFHRQLA